MKSSAVYVFLLTCLTVFFFVEKGNSQRIRVSATVTNASNHKPVPYATIQIMNTFKGTSTNDQGQFSLLVNEGDSLKISCIGFKTKTIGVNESIRTVSLKQDIQVLDDVTIFSKALDPKKIVKRAFKSIKKNYISDPVTMKTFYRHYCKDDSIYGRLIEAAVEVYKSKGYRRPKHQAFKKDYYKLVQARRSFDKSFNNDKHVPIAFDDIIGSDMVAYQINEKRDSPIMLFLSTGGKDLKANLNEYDYELDRIVYKDGKSIYAINFSMKPIKKLSAGGMKMDIKHEGQFYINAENMAFEKVKSLLDLGYRSVEDQIFYTQTDNEYYLSHVIHNQETKVISDTTKSVDKHTAHIELLVNEIAIGKRKGFKHEAIMEKVLSMNKYDPTFWSNYTVLTENPLEKEIKQQLEVEQSLQDQFIAKSNSDYKNYERIIEDNEQLQKILQDSKGEIIYIDFWASWCGPCISEFIRSKDIIEKYSDNGVRFIYASIDQKVENWKKLKVRYGLADKEHLFIGNESTILKEFKVSEIPRYMMIYPDGTILRYAPRPTSKEFIELMDLELRQLNRTKE